MEKEIGIDAIYSAISNNTDLADEDKGNLIDLVQEYIFDNMCAISDDDE